WSIEMQIPLVPPASAASDNGVFLPDATRFRMYVDVLNTLLSTPATVIQDAWPARQVICGSENPCLADDELLHNTPHPSKWGVASFSSRPECADITLSWPDIGVRNPASPSNLIGNILRGGFSLPSGSTSCSDAAVAPPPAPVNTFVARPHNGG